VKVFIDGVEQKDCFAADDAAGRALCAVRDDVGKPIHAAFHRGRDWQPKQMELDGLVVQWVSGSVEFRFDTPEVQAEAEARWRDFEQGFPERGFEWE